MDFILSIPVELLVQILQTCKDFGEVIALASSCKTFHSAWSANSTSIIWPVAMRNIAAFDDALMAVRATNIVKCATEERKLPPDPFPLHRLSALVALPNVDELKEVLNLQHMMRCIKCMIFKWELEPKNEFFQVVDEDCPRYRNLTLVCPEWTANFYKSMYRSILAGAMFSRAYLEPFFEALQGQQRDRWKDWESDSKSKETAELRSFSVYNFDADDGSEDGKKRDSDYERLFSPFADWIVEDGLKGGGEYSPDSFLSPSHFNAIGDIMRLIAAFEHLSNKVIDADGQDRHGRESEWALSNHIKGRTRKVSVVLFGIFQVEEITMPANIEDVTKGYLLARPLISGVQDIRRIIDKLCEFGRGVYNPQDRLNEPPRPFYQLFSFSLRKHFDLDFHLETFEDHMEIASPAAYKSLADPIIFCQGQAGDGLYDDYPYVEPNYDDDN